MPCKSTKKCRQTVKVDNLFGLFWDLSLCKISLNYYEGWYYLSKEIVQSYQLWFGWFFDGANFLYQEQEFSFSRVFFLKRHNNQQINTILVKLAIHYFNLYNVCRLYLRD